MNKQSKETIRKREAILEIMKEFENFVHELTDPKTLINYSLKFTRYDPQYTLYWYISKNKINFEIFHF